MKTQRAQARRPSDKKSAFCTACGCSHPPDRKPTIQAEDFVTRRIGAKVRGKNALYALAQERAEAPIQFGLLCRKLRELPPKLTTPHTQKNRYMVICTRIQDSLKERCGRVLVRCDAPYSAATKELSAQEEEKAKSAGAFDPLSIKDDRKRAIATIVRRRGQPEFRRRLLCAYGHCCAVTGCDAIDALEAAHIIPYSGEHTNQVSNGLILRSDIHTLFDLGLLSIDPRSWTVLLSEELLGTTYHELRGRRIQLPEAPNAMPSGKALRLHRTRCGL